uniref:MIP16470p n=1 Tax=Drosophila melanogaster TaxID=7227 RepID=D3DMP6_DROME|nr:MIP16470p [Drosophila melanogaster]
MESDFNTKLKFLKEQEQICLDNAKNALPIDDTLRSVKCTMLRVEMELHENEINLIQAEKAVTKLEQSYPSPESLAGQVFPLASTTYQDLLSMLMSSKKTVDHCNQIKEEVATYNEQISAKVPSVNLVTKLIDYHNNTLESMEKISKN